MLPTCPGRRRTSSSRPARRISPSCRLRSEIRNQARVHLWYPERFFGRQCPAYRSSSHSLSYFSSKTHAVGVRLAGTGEFEVTRHSASTISFSFRIVPNRVIDNRVTHEEKAARAKQRWPEISVVPW
ncbi:nucleotidyltransferase family protein [Mesorhizobium sp. AaZ16]|uniref:nucleotidyltransferase family protein n=1 Tax=Mesorhizobium sp. AaZ16 TaxID=3402289 RepID=UPI00374E9501